MSGEAALIVWSGTGILWWVIAWGLVCAASKRKVAAGELAEAAEFLSIFKPLPALGRDGLLVFAAGLESFISQLDEKSELLLGIHESDQAAVTPFVDRMRASFPQAQLVPVFRSGPDSCANPKIAWQKILAARARGELWFWSDADIVAPPGFISAAREEYARSEAGMLTFPYVMREISSAPALLDALFVNAEFYPGVLLLRACGPADFGLGAGMIFRRDEFLRRVDWEEIGSELADDFFLGQRLGPVRISGATVVTMVDAPCWRDALLRHLRWNKTVRWNRPIGAAARIIVLPVAGWLAWVILHPMSIWAWAGLLAMMQVDVCFAVAICRSAGCRLKARDLPGVEAWSLGRIVVWLACWLPWPVVWRGRRWAGPRIAPENHCVEDIDKNCGYFRD